MRRKYYLKNSSYKIYFFIESLTGATYGLFFFPKSETFTYRVGCSLTSCNNNSNSLEVAVKLLYITSSFINLPIVPLPLSMSDIILSTLANVFSKFLMVWPKFADAIESEIFEKLNEDGKTIILYGNSPGEVVTPFMILHQLGVANIKILSSEISYLENNLNSKEVEVETYQNDVTAYIQESIKKAAIVEKPKPVVVKTPKKIIPIKKKKKMPVEGGC